VSHVHVVARDNETGEYYLQGSGQSFGGVPATDRMTLVLFDGERNPVARYVEPAAQRDPHGFIRMMNQRLKLENLT
jgi:hypothetical protein